MATKANQVVVTLKNVGLIDLPGKTPESAKAVSEVLQKNHDTHHIFFNEKGFHNHILHYMLPLWDLSAPADIYRHHYEREKLYQLPKDAVTPKIVTDLTDESKWGEYLGKGAYYSDFLAFFQREIDEIGWQESLNKQLFSGTEHANKMFGRFFEGIYHAWIHIGYGVEFQLPAIIAEGLAQTAVHKDWTFPYLEECNSQAARTAQKTQAPRKTIVSILDEIRKDEKLCKATHRTNFLGVTAIMEHATEEMAQYASQFVVEPTESELSLRVAEAINAAAYFLGAAVRREKQIKFDFLLMHAVTSSLFLSVFLAQDWLTLQQKARVVESKVRIDLALFAGCGGPALYPDEIATYVPKRAFTVNPWMDLFTRATLLQDDGHAIKTLRALAHGERVCRDLQNREGFVIVGDMWMKMAAMCMDSLEDGGEKWIRETGFDQNWEKFGPRKTYTHGVEEQLGNLKV